jgi:hypothetical protein
LILCWCREKEGTEGRKEKGGIKNKFFSCSQRFLSNDVGLAEIHSSSVTRGLAKASGVGLNWDDDGGGGSGGGGGGAQFAMFEHSSLQVVTASYPPGHGKGNDQNCASQRTEFSQGTTHAQQRIATQLNMQHANPANTQRCSMPALLTHKDAACQPC